jgi:hypothetical protein
LSVLLTEDLPYITNIFFYFRFRSSGFGSSAVEEI